ncbi:MAG TPA: NAD(P)-dependent oxidoreductase [Sulfuricurvum sp.]|nr:MAG: UDP-glucose 4-epimerase [Campylobacterales bacterium 16-40-21]OZA02300.1 MAG: UDP-glucose 4-epimerase [Sulfuricurvum sp. 17-40-25]HQS67290.1 NAD(P)-dependent oxidoreductase [Sulfuricurvum sp.]HQT37249.1 NAD(P)-dependent oxidoreductase [Sulfuricurvum sp.]
MKKVVIFGGSGFLGSYVADEFTRRGYEVVIADISPSSYLQPTQRFVNINIMEMAEVVEVIKGSSFVYNFVAIANLDEAIHKPINTFAINVMGNLNILEACRQDEGIERFIYASSAYALSSDGSFYGISKHSSEKLTEEYYKRYGLKYTVIRYGSLYGERASHNNYIYNLLKDALTTRQLEYKGDGEDLREYIHAADAAKLSVDIIEDPQYENEHIILTGIEKLKRLELLIMINEIMNNTLEILQINETNMGHYKITPYSFHPSVAKKLVANPYIDLGQGLLECIQTIHNELDSE